MKITNLLEITLGMPVIRHAQGKSEACEVTQLMEINEQGQKIITVTTLSGGVDLSVNLLLYGIIYDPNTGLDLSGNNEYWLETWQDSITIKIEEK